MSKRKKVKKTTKSMTKDQVQDVILDLSHEFEQESVMISKIEKILQDDATLGNIDDANSVIGQILDSSTTSYFCSTFISLFEQSSLANPKDRFAMLQIHWNKFLRQCIVCNTAENNLVIPPTISVRNRALQQEDHATRVVVHAIGAAFLQLVCKMIKNRKPVNQSSPVVPQKCDSLDSILGFAGACMRLVFKKADKETRLLIKYLQMTDKMKTVYTDIGVLSPGTSLHKTLPVRALNKYLLFLNDCLQESCSKKALLLYKKKFVKVRQIKL